MSSLRPALVLLSLFALLTGVVYPALVTGLAQVFFPEQANGSLLHDAQHSEQALGSRLIGQPFGGPSYFWSRPSATGPVPYNAAASSGSNLGPLNPALLTTVRERVETLTAESRNSLPVPIDLVTSSASGLDPHISPAAASYQVARVAHARGLGEPELRKLVAEHSEPRTLGFLGEPRVNVLTLNLALDELATEK